MNASITRHLEAREAFARKKESQRRRLAGEDTHKTATTAGIGLPHELAIQEQEEELKWAGIAAGDDGNLYCAPHNMTQNLELG